MLKPNPNYHGTRPQRLDAIVYKVGIEPGVAAAGIAAARSTTSRRRTPPSPRHTAVGPHSRRAVPLDREQLDRAAGAQRLETAVFRRLDPSRRRTRARSPSACPRARRRRLPAADEHLAPAQPSRLHTTDVPAAPRPASRAAADAGRHLHAVFAAEADDAGNLFDPQLAQLLRTQLARIGITLTVVPLLQTLDPTQRDSVLATADLARTGGNADDARDPVQYLLHLPYLTASDRRQLDSINALPSQQRARLPQRSPHDSSAKRPTSAIRTATAELVSRRLGCRIDQPEYPGLDLAALCLTHE